MKRIIPCLLFACCFSTVHAVHENADRVIGPDEYVALDWLSGLLVVDGGGADLIEVYNSARLEVWSTTPFVAGYGGIWDIRLKNNSHLDYYGGQTEELSLRHNSTAKLYGGRIDYISTDQYVFNQIVGWDEQGNPIFNTHIEMFVRDYEFNPATMRVTGTWNVDNDDNGLWDTFNIKLLDQSSDPRFDPVFDNIKFTIIPEPTSLASLALGGLLLRRKRS